MDMLRQPIVVVMGHVDHGKTSLLDSIRKSTVAAREAGAITQHIGASEIPISVIREKCESVQQLIKADLTIPGLLFIDTPGHEAFTNLRKRGGSIADLAILVVDVAQGFQPQTIEALEILKEYKTPFVVALNKIDLITGWKTTKNECFLKTFPQQRQEVQQALDERIYTIMGELSKFGYDSDFFVRVKDYTKSVAIIPVSAKSGEGLPELLIFLSGIAQKFLEKQLQVEGGPGKGSILEVKFEKGLGTTIDVILYNGIVKKGDMIVFASKNEISETKIRGLLKPKPLIEMRDVGDRFNFVDEILAASGVKIFAPGLENALPGSEVFVVTQSTEQAIKKQLESEIKGILVNEDKIGVILRADTLGSLEAITKMLLSEGVHVRHADTGPVTKADLLEASSIRTQDRYQGAVLAFNVTVTPELVREAESKSVALIQSNIIYALLDRFKEWRAAEKKREEIEVLNQYVLPAKIKFLTGHVFRANNPAIIGVEVLVGRIKNDYELIKGDGTSIGRIKSIQAEKESKDEAKAGDNVAISLDDPTVGRHIFEGEIYYSAIPRKHALILQDKYKALLTIPEYELINYIMRIVRQ
jgi:translation initiation factor 5B